MRAVVQDQYGSREVLRLGEIEKPVAGEDEVLVRVRAASIHADIWHLMTGQPYILRLFGAGLFKPKIRVPGTDLAGHVEAVGKNVTQFQPGDEVFGESISGYQWVNGGAFAEYVSVKEKYIALKPNNLTFEQAAAVPTSGLIALNNLRDSGQMRPGQKVLINGAGGGVGIFALQLAKAHGAQVTAVDHTKKLTMMQGLGADHVIDYTQRDFTHDSARYDLILDVPGNHPFSVFRRALAPRGVYLPIGHDHFGKIGRPFFGCVPYILKLTALSFFVKQLTKPNFSLPSKKDSLAVLKRLIEEGQLTPVVDRTFPLGEIQEAMRYLQEKNPSGKVVMTM